jgi:hypothetical protein
MIMPTILSDPALSGICQMTVRGPSERASPASTPTPDRNPTVAGSAVFAARRPAYARRPPGVARAGLLVSCPPKEPQMIHPTAPQLAPSAVVRDGRRAPVTCATCGCRLQAVGPAGTEAWFHFNPLAGRDARGCRVDCADAAHGLDGRPSLVLA